MTLLVGGAVVLLALGFGGYQMLGGAHRLVSETNDAGQLTAGGGSYSMTSMSGKVINGTYQVLNANSVATQGPAGPAVWQRR
jgi:hypothetical protein